jgi:hypothetical protein
MAISPLPRTVPGWQLYGGQAQNDTCIIADLIVIPVPDSLVLRHYFDREASEEDEGGNDGAACCLLFWLL